MGDLTGFASLNTAAIGSQNGREAGALQGYSISKDGTVTGTFSNGASLALGRIALATFANPAGLEKTGASGYRATANSGGATVGGPGSAGVGSLAAGTLEMSNVDLSQEFTNLIVAQRGFQANARIITTSDEVLQELTNLEALGAGARVAGAALASPAARVAGRLVSRNGRVLKGDSTVPAHHRSWCREFGAGA